MARPRKRKGNAPVGKYAQIPVDKAKAVLGDVSATEFRVWFCLCLQCQHWANGTGKLCRSVIREFHLGSQRDVTAATKALIAKGHIVRTRVPRQRVCALYGVTHLPLNTDALAKEGFTDAEIRATLSRFSDSNSGSANSDTTVKALNDKNDISGSAKPPEQPLALPRRNRIGTFSPSLALPPWNTSKNLPSAYGNPGASSGSDSRSDIPSGSEGADSNSRRSA